MYKQLLQFEVFYQLKQRAFPIFALLFLALGIFVGKQGYAPTGVNFNSYTQVYFFTGIFSLGSVFIIMFFTISAILRDKHHKMEALIYSAPIKKTQYFWSRFLGTFIFSVLAFTPFMLGLMAGASFFGLDPERLSPFHILSYIQPWLYLVIPNIFICTSIIFAVSTLTKNNIATYVSAVFIYMLYMVSSIFLNSPAIAQSVPTSPEGMAIAALSDPFGIAAFFEQTQYWTPFQRNTQLLSFSGLFMWNRLIWILASIGVLLGTYALFSFRTFNKKVKKATKLSKAAKVNTPYKPLVGIYNFKAQFIAFKALLNMELKAVFKSIPFVAVLLMWLFMVFSELSSTLFGGGAYNDSLHPFTNILVEIIVEPLITFSFILIVFYSAELVWKERSYNFNSIIDATPVSNAVFFLSKLTTLLALPCILIISGIAMSIAFQMALGYSNFEFELYASIFYHYGLQLAVFCMIALFVHSLVKYKYLGMGIVGAIIVLSSKAAMLGLEHPLTSIGFLPHPSYTNMNGFSGITKLFNHLSLYWIAIGGMLCLLSFKLWQRGIFSSLIVQLANLKYNWTKAQGIAFIMLIITSISAASVVYYNTNIISTYETAADNLDYREQYERQFKKYESLERLYPVVMKTEVDIFPSEGMFSIKGNYVVKHKGTQPISQVFITERVPLQQIDFEDARLVEHDSVFGTYLFEFKNPIQPQQLLNYSFETKKTLKGYETDIAIVNSGTYINFRDFEPFDYAKHYEITNAIEREKRNLPKREVDKQIDSHLAMENSKYEKVDFETVMSTQNDQIALSSGELVRKWNEGDRHYFHYKSKSKVIPMLAYFSAEYATKKTNFKGISIEQYYDEDHYFNIDQIEESSEYTLDYCIENFGAYAFDHLRIAEIPGHWPFGGFAHPGLISMVEDRLYLTDIRDTEAFNLVAKRTIHEVAHQWWGHVLIPKVAPGGAIFTEGFAKYTEAVIMDKYYGKRAVYQLAQTANRRYFSGRSYASKIEPPLFLEDEESYLAYGKSYTVMLALRDLIGEQGLNTIMRDLIDRFGTSNAFGITSTHLLEALYAASPTEHHVLIDDWFKRVITYDLGINESTHKELANGQFEISIKIKAKRSQMLDTGDTKSISINEPIQIGLFRKHPRLISKDDTILYLKPHQVTKDGQEFKIIVDELPSHIAIDPYGTRTDERLTDNVIQL